MSNSTCFKNIADARILSRQRIFLKRAATSFASNSISRLSVFALILMMTNYVLAAKPSNNNAGSQEFTEQLAKRKSTGERITAAQREIFKSYGRDVAIELDDQGVPSSLTGRLSKRHYKDDPVAEARAALDLHGAAFRLREGDGFTLIRIEKDRQGVTQVLMGQIYKGIKVIGGEVVVRLNRDEVMRISGRFVADLSLSTEPDITADQAAASALSSLESEGKVTAKLVETRDPVIFIGKEKQGRLAIPVRVEHDGEEEEIFIDASSSLVLGSNVTAPPIRTLGVTNSLPNPGFELGDNGNWYRSPDVIVNYGPPHNGSWCAWMCGYGTNHNDWVGQFVSIPFDATTASFSFWLRIDTGETSCCVAYDKLRVLIRNNIGVELATVATYSNLNKTNGYIFQSFSLNLAPYRGQTIQIPYFLATEDSSLATSFYIDDVTLQINSPSFP